LCIRFVSSEGGTIQQVDIPEPAAFELAVAAGNDETTTIWTDPPTAGPAILSEDALVDIAGDWDDIDRDTGLISIRYDTETEDFVTAVSGTKSIPDVPLQIRMLVDARYQVLLDDYCWLANIINPSSASVPAPATPGYYTSAQVDNLIAAQAADTTALAARVTALESRADAVDALIDNNDIWALAAGVANS
jgi:hypothetical protein